jgi:type IV pilus assembly protein PilE
MIAITKKQHGFTLLELITVVAMINILIMISYPAYTKHVIKTNRSHATVALLNMSAAMERYYVLNHSYEGASLFSLEMNEFTQSEHYQLQIKNSGQSHYQLEAIPQNAQQKDKACGTLSLDEVGRKGVSGEGSIQDCW